MIVLDYDSATRARLASTCARCGVGGWHPEAAQCAEQNCGLSAVVDFPFVGDDTVGAGADLPSLGSAPVFPADAENHVGARQVLTDDLVAAAAAIVAGDLQSEPEPNPPASPVPVAAPQEKPMTDHISAEQLRLLIERIERLEEEKKGISDDIKDVYAEAKSTGFDVKTMREVVKLRKMEKHHRDEAETLLEVYKQALGI